MSIWEIFTFFWQYWASRGRFFDNFPRVLRNGRFGIFLHFLDNFPGTFRNPSKSFVFVFFYIFWWIGGFIECAGSGQCKLWMHLCHGLVLVRIDKLQHQPATHEYQVSRYPHWIQAMDQVAQQIRFSTFFWFDGFGAHQDGWYVSDSDMAPWGWMSNTRSASHDHNMVMGPVPWP